MAGSMKERAAVTYNAAVDPFDAEPLTFWERFGTRTVERLELRPDSLVLDVCCGTGASALPAAERVLQGGRVVAVDLTERLVDLGRAKAADRGLHNIEFVVGDMERLGYPDGHFGAVVCVFGVFFLPDVPGVVRELWRMVGPGGRLAVTTWGPNVLEPAARVFWEAVHDERPDLYQAYQPWDRITTPEMLDEVLREGGVEGADIVAEPGEHPLQDPGDWWRIVLGTGFRGTLERMEPAAVERVRQKNLAWLRDHEVRSLEANVVYAVATKDADA